jgi:hypothetical protein
MKEGLKRVAKNVVKDLDVILFVVVFNIGMHLLLQIVK